MTHPLEKWLTVTLYERSVLVEDERRRAELKLMGIIDINTFMNLSSIHGYYTMKRKYLAGLSESDLFNNYSNE